MTNESGLNQNNSESVQETISIGPKQDKHAMLMRDKEIFEEVLNEFIADFWEKAPRNPDNSPKYAQNSSIMPNNGNNSTILSNIAQGNVEKCTNPHNQSSSQDDWNFSGFEIRTIVYYSSLKVVNLVEEIGLSRNTISSYFKQAFFPSEITKIIARKLDLHSPNSLRQYYHNIPAEKKAHYNRDCRIRRIAKPGLFIPKDVYKAAELLNRVGDLSALARARAKWL